MPNTPVHQQFSDAQKAQVVGWFGEGKTQSDIAALLKQPRRTIMKLCTHLGLKRSISDTAKLKTSSPYEHLAEQVKSLRPTHSLPQISKQLSIPLSSLARLCERHGIEGPVNFSELQSKRMKAVWTGDKKRHASVVSKQRATAEVRHKIATKTTQLWQDPEYRAKQTRIQKIVWSDIELRQRMSSILSEYWDDDERRAAMAAVQAAIWTDDKKAQMSATQQKLWADPEKRRRISELMKIVWADPALRAADSERMKRIWSSLELRERDSELVRELWQNSDYRDKTTARLLEAMADPAIRAKISAASRAKWKEDDYRVLMAKFRAAQPRVSSLQRMLYDMLDDLGVAYHKEYDGDTAATECVVGPYTFDCLIPRPGQKALLVECHGEYWHSLAGAIRVDKAKATYVERYHSDQYELRYLWEHEFSCQDRVIETIKHWLGITRLEVTGFDFADLRVGPTEAAHYRPLLSKYHYLANAGRGGVAYGAYLGEELIAVCVFSPLLRHNIDTMGFKGRECVELSRLCIHPRYQKPNLASWFVSRCLKQLDKKVKLVISYCDTTFNHDGAVYKSLNFQQDKSVRPDYWYVDGSGWVMHKKTLYSRAVRLGMTEAGYAEKNGYRKVYGTEKLRFIYRRK